MGIATISSSSSWADETRQDRGGCRRADDVKDDDGRGAQRTEWRPAGCCRWGAPVSSRKPPSIILCSFSPLDRNGVRDIYFAQFAATWCNDDRLHLRTPRSSRRTICFIWFTPNCHFCGLHRLSAVRYRDVAFLFCSLRAWTWFNYSLIGILLKFAFKETRTSSFYFQSTAPRTGH